MNGLKINIHPCSMKKTMKTDPEAIRKKFGDNYIADDRTFKMGIDLRFAAHIADRFQGRNVLETCTGGGFTIIALARVAARVITVEINPAAQAQARKNERTAGISDVVTFISGDIMDKDVLKLISKVNAAFLDPDWADADPGHIYRFIQSNTRPPADKLLDMILKLSENVALVLPPFLDAIEFIGLPAHECQKLYLGKNHKLFCLYFGDLADCHGVTTLNIII